MKILVTGTAGFIGYHLANNLIARGDEVIGVDNINDYYDVNLKYARLADTGIDREQIEYNKLIQSQKYSNYQFIKLHIEDAENINDLFAKEKFDKVCNLAAQAGVRYSLDNPQAYIQSNIVGFINILEACRHNNIKHLAYASSSSVYGLNESIPFSTHDNVDHPISIYAATKKSNELMAHTYSYLFNLPTTGLRFFTVYGPWGRPDMAPFLFTRAIIAGQTINVFNNGDMYRDFTFIDDIIEGIKKVLDSPANSNLLWSGQTPDPSSSKSPYKIYNIGNNSPISLMDFIDELENNLNKTAKKCMKPIQPGDIHTTNADVSDLMEGLNYKPSTAIKDGIKKFIDWYLNFYN